MNSTLIRHFAANPVAIFFSGCATYTPPDLVPTSDARESEYAPYLKAGTATLRGQAFLVQRGGGVGKGAMRTVTLDPATPIGMDGWDQAGKQWIHKDIAPSSKNFIEARRTTVTDAEGRFSFSDLPAGKYYVRTSVTWETGGYNPTQGGLVGKAIIVQDGKTTDVVLNEYPN